MTSQQTASDARRQLITAVVVCGCRRSQNNPSQRRLMGCALALLKARNKAGCVRAEGIQPPFCKRNRPSLVSCDVSENGTWFAFGPTLREPKKLARRAHIPGVASTFEREVG